jgi:hypothetical protein
LLDLDKHYELANIQHVTIEATWLMHDSTVLMSSLSAICEEECYKLEMTISEASIKDDARGHNILAFWNMWPDAEVMADNMIKADLISFLAAFGGILMYKLKRKNVYPYSLLGSMLTLHPVSWKSEGYKSCIRWYI